MTLRINANQWVPSADVALATDVYRPASKYPVTVVVTRTAYGKRQHLDEGRAWAARGYGYVVQDIRGRYESEGEWAPYLNERADGGALLDWLRVQPWVGDIVLLGGSYSAFTAWSAAVARPGLPTAVISFAATLGFDRVKYDPSGVLRLDEHVHWWVDRADGRVDRPGLAAAMVESDPPLLSHLPVVELDKKLWVDAPGWRKIFDSGTRSGPESITEEELGSVRVHSLHVCGWYDLVAADAIELWQQLTRQDKGDRSHRLVLGPWDHDLTLSTALARSRVMSPKPFDLGATMTAWLRDLDDGEHRSGIQVLPIGGKTWLSIDSWPPSLVTDGPRTRWYPSPNGELVTDEPSVLRTITFLDDPAQPLPSVVPGWDRRPLEGRQDLLRCTSDPLAEPLHMGGRARLRLKAESNAPSADWIVRLAVVCPDGRIAELTSGTLESLETGPVDVTVELAPFVAILDAGARLRLEISGTDFPRLCRNLGTGLDRYRTSDVRCSTRLVDTATELSLPVLAEFLR